MKGRLSGWRAAAVPLVAVGLVLQGAGVASAAADSDTAGTAVPSARILGTPAPPVSSIGVPGSGPTSGVVVPLGNRVCRNVAEGLVACGTITNLSGTAVVAYKSWCKGRVCGNSDQRRLTRGQSTPWYEDWDAVWVPCRAVGFKQVAGGTARYPWTGSGGRPGGVGAHRVYDPEDLFVTGVFC
jgi:hypothetical protein